jgi:hypothetical protein
MRYRFKMLALALLGQGSATAAPMIFAADTAFPIMVVLVLISGIFLGHAILGAPRSKP